MPQAFSIIRFVYIENLMLLQNWHQKPQIVEWDPIEMVWFSYKESFVLLR